MMPYRFAYISGCAVLAILWLVIFLFRKDLRKEMLWASLWGMPFGFIDFFLVPYYWMPDSLFGFIKTYGVGIESFVFMFLMSGITAVVYEFLTNKKIVKIKRDGKTHFWLLLVTTLLYIALLIFFPRKAVYGLMLATFVGTIITLYFRRDLLKQVLASAFIFSFLYFAVFVCVNLMFKGWVQDFYNLHNILGFMIAGVPLEEIGAAFFAGAFWSTIYEFTKGYRLK